MADGEPNQQRPEVELGGDQGQNGGASPGGPQGTDANVRDIGRALGEDEALQERTGVAFSPSQLVMAIVQSIVIAPPAAGLGGQPMTPEQRAAGFQQLVGSTLAAVDFDGNVIALLERGGIGANLSPAWAVGIGAVAIIGGAFLYRTPKAAKEQAPTAAAPRAATPPRQQAAPEGAKT